MVGEIRDGFMEKIMFEQVLLVQAWVKCNGRMGEKFSE